MPTDAKRSNSVTNSPSIDGLVREVIRRLATTNLSATNIATTSCGSTNSESKHYESTSYESTNGAATTTDEKVITLATIEGMTDAHKRLNIQPNAVVTPAARDEAKRRNITIEQTTNQPQTSVSSTHPSVIDDALHPQRAEAMAAQLQRRGIASSTTKIILSDTPGRDVYEQCAKHGQRSVMVTSLSDIDRFAAELSPTSWVLDMTRLNFVAATNVAARIAQRGK